MKRTSKKQIHELEKHVRETIDEGAMLYARYEMDATGNAYARINGRVYTYKSNSAMYDAVADMILSADEPEQISETAEPDKIQVVGGNAIYRSTDPATNEVVFTVAGQEFWTLAEARYFAQCNPTEATKEAINSGLETAIHASQESESNEKAAKLAAEAEKPAAERATLEAKQDASFAAYEAYDARITAENTYNLASVEELAKKADEAAKKAEEAADKAESEARKADSARAATIAKLAREQAEKARHNAHLAAMEAEERRKYAADLEEEAKADAAAASFCAAYEDATGNPPYFEEAASVCRVARAEIANESGATHEDHETVSAMVDSIAEQAETAAAYAAFEANRREHIGEYLVKYEWSGEGLYRIAWSDGGQKSDPHHYETAEELAADLTSAYQHATETHQPYAERLEYYERHELLAYLGTPSDFDVSAIEEEATDTDQHGARYWTADPEELAAIAQRNQR